MAHIVEFSIKGLTGRKEDINITLNRDVNVFFGLNGSGKTSLLKILHSAMSNDSSILKDVPFSEAKVVIYSIAHNKNYECTIQKEPKLTASKRSMKIDPRLWIGKTKNSELVNVDYQSYFSGLVDQPQWEVTPEQPNSSKAWAHTYLPISRLYVGSISSKRESSSDISEDQLDARFSDILQQVWMKYSYDVNSLVREAQEDGLANILRELLSPSGRTKKASKNIPPELALERVKSFLSRQKKKVALDEEKFIGRYSTEPGMRSVVGDIDRVERNIEQAVFPIEKLNTLIHQLFGFDKKVNFSGREIVIQLADGTTITPQQLSSGEKHLLKLLIEVTAIKESTIIIDEPELSMHIDWQKTLLQTMNMLNPDTQLIVATHSPEVMSEIEDSKIFRI